MKSVEQLFCEPFEGIDLFVPDAVPIDEGIVRITHLGIGAHADDLEIFAYPGIEEVYGREDRWFGGVTVTNGSGSPRVGKFAGVSDKEMMSVRLREQRTAAVAGGYGFQAQLKLASSQLVDRDIRERWSDWLACLFSVCKPEVLFMHQPFDHHPTHRLVAELTWQAVLKLETEQRPKTILAGEVWGGLDSWPPEMRKTVSADRYPDLAQELIEIYESQVEGGKNYVEACLGRRSANATFLNPHEIDSCRFACHYLDLSGYAASGTLSLSEVVSDLMVRAKQIFENR